MTDKLPKVLVVDDEAENLKAIERTLKGQAELTLCSEPEAALAKMQENTFSVVLSDQRMPGMLGTELLARMQVLSPHTTRVILTAFTETAEILEAINRAEIYRYVTKPWDNAELVMVVRQAVERYDLIVEREKLLRELQYTNQNLEKIVSQRTAELRVANDQLSELAMTDPLTKIWNRRAFFARLTEEVERSKRYRHPIAVAMVDVDHFKQFNDMEGHPCGDEALRKIAATLRANLRRTDNIGRYGGEEFVVLMPETNVSDAADICERLRSSVEAESFQGGKGPAYLTVSVGLSCFPAQGQTSEELVQSADQALYQAKQAGRNRVQKPSERNDSFFVR